MVHFHNNLLLLPCLQSGLHSCYTTAVRGNFEVGLCRALPLIPIGTRRFPGMLIISTRRKPRGRPTYGDSSLRTSSIPHLPGSLFDRSPANAAFPEAAFPPTVPLPDTDSIQGLILNWTLPWVLTLPMVTIGALLPVVPPNFEGVR